MVNDCGEMLCATETSWCSAYRLVECVCCSRKASMMHELPGFADPKLDFACRCAHLVVDGDCVAHHNALVWCSAMGAAPATTLLRAQRLLDELYAATVLILAYHEGHVCCDCPFAAAQQTVQSKQVWELVRVVGLLRRTPTRARAPLCITLVLRMATLTQSRALAGSKAFTGLRPRRVAQVANGGKVFMRRNDAYMIEVRTSTVNADACQKHEDGLWDWLCGSCGDWPLSAWEQQLSLASPAGMR